MAILLVFFFLLHTLRNYDKTFFFFSQRKPRYSVTEDFSVFPEVANFFGMLLHTIEEC